MTGTGPLEASTSASELQRRLADFAMVLDLLGTLPALMDEEKVFASIFDLFTMLCAPSSIVYVSTADRQQKGPPCGPRGKAVSPEVHSFLTADHLDHALTSSGKGFLVRLRHAAETLGVLEIDGVAYPQYLSHYLQLALTIAQVCGLAVQNARIYERLRSSIEDRERAEREVMALNDELERRIRQVEFANRELDAFVYAVSHDLRAPLRAMHGFSQALVEDYGASLSGLAREYLDQISLAGRNMGQIIEGLLKLSRTTRGELQHDSVDLSTMAMRILGDLAAVEPTRRVSWTVKPGLTARGDARMIEVVLANLLGNAWKYTANCAEALIEVGEMEGADHQETGSLRQHPQGPISVYFVRDNGAGFDMRYIDKLFRPFQRLHRQDEFPGIGIGLATVQRIIDRHGGTVWSTAAPGQGAAFYFSLPSPSSFGEDPS